MFWKLHVLIETRCIDSIYQVHAESAIVRKRHFMYIDWIHMERRQEVQNMYKLFDSIASVVGSAFFKKTIEVKSRNICFDKLTFTSMSSSNRSVSEMKSDSRIFRHRHHRPLGSLINYPLHRSLRCLSLFRSRSLIIEWCCRYPRSSRFTASLYQYGSFLYKEISFSDLSP